MYVYIDFLCNFIFFECLYEVILQYLEVFIQHHVFCNFYLIFRFTITNLKISNTHKETTCHLSCYAQTYFTYNNILQWHNR